MDYTLNIFSLIIIIFLLILVVLFFYTNKKNINCIEQNFKLNIDKLEILKQELQNSFNYNQQSFQKLEGNIQLKMQNLYDENIKLNSDNLQELKQIGRAHV